jgi:hypothetical protein
MTFKDVALFPPCQFVKDQAKLFVNSQPLKLNPEK